MVIINCPDCNELIRLPDDAGGNTIQCLKCKSIILIHEQPVGALVESSGEVTETFAEDE